MVGKWANSSASHGINKVALGDDLVNSCRWPLFKSVHSRYLRRTRDKMKMNYSSVKFKRFVIPKQSQRTELRTCPLARVGFVIKICGIGGLKLCNFNIKFFSDQKISISEYVRTKLILRTGPKCAMK